jgi:hypothetical protein
MQVIIEPSDFARIMTLPLTQRHDVLEFLGSTPVESGEIEKLLRAMFRRNGPGERTTVHDRD